MKKRTRFLSLLLLLTILTACTTTPTPTTLPTTTTAAPTAEPTTEPPDPPDYSGSPMLFHVTGPDGEEGWLFGTIHAGDERNDQVMDRLIPYLEGSDALAVELDILAYEADARAQIAALVPFVLTDGTTIDQHMSEETYQAARKILIKAKMTPSTLKRYNVALWAQLVEQALLLTSQLDPDQGMDRKLIQSAYDRDLPVREVESAEYQYSLLASFPEELSLLMLEDLIEGQANYGQSLDDLYAAWVDGDREALTAIVTEEPDPEAYTPEELNMLRDYSEQMLDQRNEGMSEKLIAWLRAGDKVFFAVGAAHLLGDAGLISLLQSAGFTVDRVVY